MPEIVDEPYSPDVDDYDDDEPAIVGGQAYEPVDNESANAPPGECDEEVPPEAQRASSADREVQPDEDEVGDVVEGEDKEVIRK